MPPYFKARVRSLNYREEAAQIREMASKSGVREIQEQLLNLAAQYERLAERDDPRDKDR
jgi:hypothetical protein